MKKHSAEDRTDYTTTAVERRNRQDFMAATDVYCFTAITTVTFV
jgi:hypothetical protein